MHTFPVCAMKGLMHVQVQETCAVSEFGFTGVKVMLVKHMWPKLIL